MDINVKRIADNLMDNIVDVMNNPTSTFLDKAEQVTNLLSASIPFIKKSAIRSVTGEESSNKEIDDFVNDYLASLQEWKLMLYNMLEKTSRVESIDEDFLLKFKSIINEEIQFVYKNVQILIADINKCDFIVHDSACAVCKFLLANKCLDKLKEHFKNDECDSYLKIKVDLFTTDNLISPNVRIYNVPVKQKKMIANFYKLISLQYKKEIKEDIKIKYVEEFQVNDKEKQEIADMIRLCWSENEYHIKFDVNTWQRDLLKVLIKFEEVPEKIKDVYYAKIEKHVIFPRDKFITFLAGENPQQYFEESYIEYILHPQMLLEIDNEIFDYFNERKNANV